MRREESRHDFAFLAGVVIGAVAGALATLALAPRAGMETRERWRSQLQEMPVDELRSRAGQLREVAVARGETLREAAGGVSPADVVQTTRARMTDIVDRSPLPITLGGDVEDVTAAAASSLEEAADDARAEASAVGSALAEETDEVIEETAGRLPEVDGEDADDESKPE